MKFKWQYFSDLQRIFWLITTTQIYCLGNHPGICLSLTELFTPGAKTPINFPHDFRGFFLSNYISILQTQQRFL